MNERIRRSRILSAGLLAAVVAACGSDGGGPGNVPGPGNPAPGLPTVALAPAFPALAFSGPVVLLQAPGDATRWFVAEQRGVVYAFENTAAVANATPFIDIRDRVNTAYSESGLLGMAFAPGFPSVPFVYLSYTATGTAGAVLESRVSRFTSTDGGLSLDAASEVTLLTVRQEASNHNGGNLGFGPDGFLYAGFGDGGGAGDPGNNGQNPTNLLGTIVRIDVEGGTPYAVPPTNPFAGNQPCIAGASTTGSACPEIYAWGFRNPWRFSFDRLTGNLWVGDVGQSSWEEIDRVEAGGNYGWNVREGAHCFEPPTGCATTTLDPVAEYSLATSQSVTGGYVYRGNLLPDLQSWYVFADFAAGTMFAVPADSEPTVMPEVLLTTTRQFATFGEDGDGELLLVDYASGTLHRLVAAP